LGDLFNRYTMTFFDDIDISYFSRRGHEGKKACSLLGAMDGLQGGGHRIRIFTTNETINEFDEAFRRPGRIDAVFELNPPDRAMREKLVAKWPANMCLQDNVREWLLDNTESFSFAELEAVRSIMVMNHIMGGAEWNPYLAVREVQEKKSEKNQQRKVGL
jgi:SpoVK/Ycf46/Vps4 family AAA+-type ATPase